jgi:uncharacterized protein (TIGR02186 family)
MVSRAGKSVICLVLMLLVQGAFAQSDAVKLKIEPQEILVGLFYNGARVQVDGESRAGEDLVAVFEGEESTVELKQKGKMWGLFWVNTGDISFRHVPLLYQVSSTRKLSDLAPEADLIRDGIGFPALEAKAAPGANEVLHRSFLEFTKLKMHEGLYSVQEGDMEVHPEGDRQKFSATFDFPPSMKPGNYRLRLMTFEQGRAVKLADREISVRLAGIADFIRSLSMNHGLVYGILSVVIALAAGLLTGFLFGGRSGKVGH